MWRRAVGGGGSAVASVAVGRAGVGRRVGLPVRRYATPSSTGPAFNVERGVGVQRDGLGRHALPRSWKPKWQPQAQKNPLHALLRVERHAGARVVHINAHPASHNRLDVVTVRALITLLQSYETNDGVTTVILRGATDGLFSAGTDTAELTRRLASPDTRATALDHLRQLYRLQQLVAQYTKPLVVGMHGVTLGSAYALASHARYAYATEETVVGVTDITAGVLPHGGATYHLARAPGGVGMYMALTGALLRGSDAYWSGLVPMYGLSQGAGEAAWSTAVSRASGDVNASATRLWELDSDPVYRKALATLRDHRATGRLQLVQDNLGDDISRATFDHYTRLKRWYAFIAAGDPGSAERSLTSDRVDEAEELGDLFDFHQGPEIDGRDHIKEPAFAAAERRARFGAVAGYAAAVHAGALDGGPSADWAVKSKVIRHAFSGDEAAPPLAITPDLPPARRTREDVMKRVAASPPPPLPPTWSTDATLLRGVTLTACLTAVYERMGIVPVESEVIPLVNAIRMGVMRAWPTGFLSDVQLADVCFSSAVPDRQQSRDIVSRGIAYVTARLLGEDVACHDAWVLEDPGLVAREVSAEAAAWKARYGGAAVPPPTIYKTTLTGPVGVVDAASAKQVAAQAQAAAASTSSGGGLGDEADDWRATPRLINPGVDVMYYSFSEEDAMAGAVPEDESDTYTPPLTPVETAAEMTPTVHHAASVTSVVAACDTARHDLLRLLGRATGAGSQAASALYIQALSAAAFARPPTADAVSWGMVAGKGLDAGMSPHAQRQLGRRAQDDGATSMAPAVAAATVASLLQHAARACQVVVQAAATAGTGGATSAVTAEEAEALAGVQGLLLDEAAAPSTVSTSAGGSNAGGVPEVEELMRKWGMVTKALKAGGGKGAPAGKGGKGGSAAAATPAAIPVPLTPDQVRALTEALRQYVNTEVALLGTPTAQHLASALRSGGSAFVSVEDMAAYQVGVDAGDGTITLLKSVGGKAAPRPAMSGALAQAGGSAHAAAHEDKATWQPAHIRRAMTSPTYMADTFGLPATPDVLASTERATHALKMEADGRWAVTQCRDVDAIVERLRSVVATSKRGGGAEKEASFAAATLKQLESLPPPLLRATHALVRHASTVSLRHAMMAEFRAVARVHTGLSSLDVVAGSGTAAADIAATLTAPFPDTHTALDLHLPRHRRAYREQARARAAELQVWLSQLEPSLESGLGPGVMGDILRRRYTWFKSPYEGWDGAQGQGDAAWARQDAALESFLGDSGGSSDVGDDAWAMLKTATPAQLAAWAQEVDTASAGDGSSR